MSAMDKLHKIYTTDLAPVVWARSVGVEVLNELDRVHQSAYNLRDLARQHHLERAKICSKLIKYPNIEDYTASCYSSLCHWSR